MESGRSLELLRVEFIQEAITKERAHLLCDIHEVRVKDERWISRIC